MLEWGFAQVDQQWFNTPALLASAERMYEEVKPLQPKYWRIGAAWPLIAKTRDPGTFIAGTPPTSTGRDWSTLDTPLNEGLLLGCDIVLILGVRKASWGGFQFGPFSFGATVGTPADFGAFCAEVATRYKVGGPGIRTDGRYASNAGKGVHIFEIWNEQNDQNHWGGQISAQDYTNHLIAGYDAIKAVSGLSGTNSRVLFGGTYHVQRQPPWWGYGIASLPELEFLSQCYTYGAKDKFDAMNMHLYPNLDDLSFNGSDVGPAPTMNMDNFRQLVEIRALMVAKGDGAKKISITEAGFPVSVVGEALQKTYWEQLWGLLSALPYVDMVLFYCAIDGGGSVTSENGSLGAMRADFTHRPVWEWLMTLTPLPTVPLAATGSGLASVTTVMSYARTASATGSGAASATADIAGFERLAIASGSGTSTVTVSVRITMTTTATGSGVAAATVEVPGVNRTAATTGTGTAAVSVVAPVLWNSTGAGDRTATTTAGSKTVDWLHDTTVTGSDVWVFAELGWSTFGNWTGLSVGCNYGSTPMTLLGSKTMTQGGVLVFGLQNPPTGSQTVTATITPTGTTVTSWQGTSVSFTNVGEVVTPVIGATGTTQVRSVTVAAAAGSRALAVMAGSYTVPGAMTVSHTQRYLSGAAVSGNGDTVSVQDGPGEVDGFVTLTTVNTGISETWAALGMVLNPAVTATADATGSGTASVTTVMSYARTATASGSGASGVATAVSWPITTAATGGGTATAELQGNPAADATGSGTASVTTVIVYAITAAASGSGTASVGTVMVYARTADAAGEGTATSTVAPTNVAFPYTLPFNLG